MFFSQVRLSHVLRFIFVCNLFTDYPSYQPGLAQEAEQWSQYQVDSASSHPNKLPNKEPALWVKYVTKHITWIFMRYERHCLLICLLLAYLSYFSTLKMEPVSSFDTSFNFYHAIRFQILEHINLHSPSCENLKYHKIYYRQVTGVVTDNHP
jgi:hypothetical protein